MNHLGPGDGRDRSPESIAEGIMNQSDEGLDDLLEGTEIIGGDDAEPDFEDDGPQELFGDNLDFESDDSGDYD